VSSYGPALLFLWVLVDQLGLPIPSLPALLAAGALARSAGLNPVELLGVAVAASLLADALWYEIGRRGGANVLHRLCRISLEPDSCVRVTEDLFARHGVRSLLIAKFVPGLSTVAPPLAGIFRMPFPRFLFFSALGALLWAGGSIVVGYVFSEQLQAIVSAVGRMGSWVGFALALVLAYVLLKWFNRQRFLRSIRIGRVRPEELKAKLDAGEAIVVVDLRSSLDFEAEPETIPGALRINGEDLVNQHQRIPRDRDVILFCT
jgi:membrane protein DedA with SNARE-associated domain